MVESLRAVRRVCAKTGNIGRTQCVAVLAVRDLGLCPGRGENVVFHRRVISLKRSFCLYV